MEEAEQQVHWIVDSASSQSELHPASNVLDMAVDNCWLTESPSNDAWLCLEPLPPLAFHRVEIVNAGSALLEIYGLREDVLGDADSDYELLLSAQQVMSVKDLLSKSNRNQTSIYDTDGNRKLAPVAALQRWRKIRVNCRQPFGTSEHRACIGLGYIKFTPCPCKEKAKSYNSTQVSITKSKPAVTNTKRKLPSWLSSSLPSADDELPEKKPKASRHKDVVKPVTQEGSNSTELEVPELGGSLKLKSQGLNGKADAQHPAFEDRVADDSGTGEEREIGRSLKKRSPDATEKKGKERKKSKVEKETSSRVGSVVPIVSTSDDADRDQIEKKLDYLPPRTGDKSGQGESSQRKMDRSKEKEERVKREENQVRGVGMKDESEREFSKLLEGVIFTISGIQNPERGELRTRGLEMGAQYRPDWTTDCTLLVCAYIDTPKFKQVQASDGSIVSKDWILECHKKRKLVDFERFVLNIGRPWRLPEKEVKRKKVNCGSVEAIRKWAQEDLKLIVDWLLQQDEKPDPEELEFTAAQGIRACLEDTVKSLTETQGLSSVIENWGFLPRAVKELAAIEEGYTQTSISTLQEAERLKGIYDEVLNEFLASSRKPTNVIDDHNKGNDEVEDDDATEIMSDVDSQETVDYDSDDTIVLDSEAIVECTQKLMERFARNK